MKVDPGLTTHLKADSPLKVPEARDKGMKPGGGMIKIGKHKVIEVCLYTHSFKEHMFIVQIDFSIRYRGDHGGFNISFGLFNVMFEFDFYDIRHREDM